MRILISGSTGLIGRSISADLKKKGHEVIPLVRDSSKSGVSWDPESGKYAPEDFEGFDAIIHLAGKSIASGRWTNALKQEIFESRCRDTWLLSQIIKRLKTPPKTLIVASGVGFYGNRGDTVLTERDPSGSGFLSDVCKQWEGATSSINRDQTRVIHTRFGIVLSKEGGALMRLLKQFRRGLGAIIAKGDQYLSWVALEDVVKAVGFLLEDSNIEGPVNVVSPLPKTNRSFSKKLSRALKRPCWVRIPAWLIRALMGGEMADEMVLASTRVIPEKLASAGFTFQYERVEDFFSTL